MCSSDLRRCHNHPVVRDPGFRKGEGAGGLLGLTGLVEHDLPRFRALRKGKTPTPACLVVLSGERFTYYNGGRSDWI